jgi:flagellar biosynthesis chaperone FliJ
MDELDDSIIMLTERDHIDMPRFINLVKEKTASVRKNIAELDAHIERTMTEWENIKKKEMSIEVLEENIRRDSRPTEG